MSTKTFGTAALISAIAVGALAYRSSLQLAPGTAGAATKPDMMAMPVPVAPIVRRTIPIYLDYAARTESIRAINLQAKISGYILRQDAADGADVKEGDLLYSIDPRDFNAALEQAQAQAQRDAASLDYARSNLKRGEALNKSGYLAKDTFEQRASATRQGEAALAMDEAAIRAAQINLAYTEIRAAFAGRLGRNQAAAGALVNAGGAALNTLVQLAPIYVTFNPSENDLSEIQKAQKAGVIQVEVFSPGGEAAPHKGELTFLDNGIDRATGTIAARATIANEALTLLPGQYVRIRLRIREQPDALMVPQAALGSSQLGKYVYVVGAENKAEQRMVSVGPTLDDLVAVSGVSAGDQVITGNLQKIGPGAPVSPLPAARAGS